MWGHLMPIPISEAKRKYIQELKRIGKHLVLIEPVDPLRSENTDFLDKRETVFVYNNPR